MKSLSRWTRMVAGALLVMVAVLGGTAEAATPQVAAGSNHTIFLYADGTLWGAGLNLFGQLGDGSFTSRDARVRVGSDATWTAISAGSSHNLALKADGTLWSWGNNDSGQLGVTDRLGQPLPDQNKPVQVGTERGWIAVAAGGDSSYALKGDGTLWAWGSNALGQLGNGDPAPAPARQPRPVQVLNPSLDPGGSGGRYVAIAGGAEHALALQSDGSLWAWGGNGSGQLAESADRLAHATPSQILVQGALSDNDWTAIAAGDGHSVGLKADGSLWSWGDNGSGQLGRTTAEPSQPAPVGSDRDWAGITAGSLHTMAWKRNGLLWGFGDNRSGQLGAGLPTQQGLPIPIALPAGTAELVALSAGAFHTVALRADGEILAWGDNGTGQFGNGNEIPSLTPLPVGSVALGWVATGPGNQFTLARRSDGTLWSWGDNGSGQLGDGSSTAHSTPARIGGAANWGAHAAGLGHAVALRSDGTLWSWGDNTSGQLGDGTKTDHALPVQIVQTQPASAVNDWKAISVGDFHTLALKGDGSLWSWGDNSSGQLGDGTGTSDRTRPTRIVTGNPGNFDNNWVAIAAGGEHSLGLQADGTLWAWGDNQFGQLGDPALTASRVPNQVINFAPPTPGFNSGWKAVAAGLDHSLALQADGTAWAWGSNFSGQLGNGDQTLPHPPDQMVPVAVAGLGSPLGLDGGDSYSVALLADGTIWSFGNNTSGQLGIGATDPDPLNPVPQPRPVQEAGRAANWAGVENGGSHTVALAADGTLWAWGSNASGQLGDGTLNDRNLPGALLEGFLQTASTVDFGPVGVGSVPSARLTVANSGNGSLFVTGVTLSGADSSQFSLGKGSCSDTQAFVVPPKGSCDLSVSFSALHSEGTKAAAVALASSDPVRPVTAVSLAASVLETYLVTVSITPADAGNSTPPGPLQVLPDSTPRLSFAPSTGYHLVDVSLNGVSKGAVSALTLDPVNANVAIAASFAANSYRVTLSSGANGTVTGPANADFGTTPSYSIAAATGYHVTDVTVNGVSKGALTALTLDPVAGDVAVAASFAVNSYTVTLNAGAHGTISGPTSVTYGATPTYRITADAGSFVTSVTVNGVAQGALTALTLPAVTGDAIVAASFDVTTYTVNASGDSGGSISPAGATVVPYGSSQSYSFTPKPGYQVVEVEVDGVRQGAISSYTFANVTGNGHSVKVTFIPDGDLNGDGKVDLVDALKALQISVGVAQASPFELRHGDVAPLGSAGLPVPDQQIAISDALVILRKAVGLTSGF